MEGEQILEKTLDYVEFRIFPTDNRYEASVWSSNKEENLSSGHLEQLLLLSPEIRNLSSKDSNTNFKILPPDSINDACWFTKATLKRFLHVISLPDILTIGKEISQLEETRKFSMSSSDKSEILVAVDLRLTALKEELAAVLNQTIGSKYSLNDISDLANFALHFGAKDLRDGLQKCVELILTEDEDSSDDQHDAERSRGVTRSSITPKRSASPMKRIQIGRSGSRRTAALSIKNLNYREKSTPLRDEGGESNEEEDSHTPVKNNVLRMSVQDKISLFESKQRDQGVVNVQKTSVIVSANKAVLRRWSSEMGETINSPENIDSNGKTETNDDDNNNDSKTETCPEKETSEEVKVEKVDEREEIELKHVIHPASIEWSQEKEIVTSDNTKSKVPKEQRVGIHDQNNKRKEEKLQKQSAGKSKLVSTNVTGVNRKHQNEPQKAQKNSTQSINSRITKPSVTKKPTRKSPSSSPQPATGINSANSTPTNRKPKSPAPKVEISQPRLKTTPLKSTKPIKATNEKKHPKSTGNRNTTRNPKVEDASITTKPSFYNKVTKKNCVVPLEPKPFLRKGSGIGPGVGPVVIKSRVEETSRTSDNPIQNKVDIMIIDHEMESESETSKNLEQEAVKIEQSESVGELGLELSETNDVTEEKVEISPNAWVEMENENEDEENHEDEIIPFKESPVKIGITLPRVRHSLSQMLLEESNESDDIGEWGNDSHPPTLIYHKDAPRGLKRLLKFARKAKAESHLTAWSSPEGDDDFEESKATRSFFSLSAFRGNKANETKLLHR